MQSHSENQSSPAGDEKGIPAGWNIPKPVTIPPPTYWPFILSLGATLIGLGVLTSLIIGATGIVLFFLAIVKWVGELCSEE